MKHDNNKNSRSHYSQDSLAQKAAGTDEGPGTAPHICIHSHAKALPLPAPPPSVLTRRELVILAALVVLAEVQ